MEGLQMECQYYLTVLWNLLLLYQKEQDTINFKTFENMKLLLKGRHDPAVIRRI